MSPSQRTGSPLSMLIKSGNKFQFRRPLEGHAGSLLRTGVYPCPSDVSMIKTESNSVLELVQYLTPMFPTVGKLNQTIQQKSHQKFINIS